MWRNAQRFVHFINDNSLNYVHNFLSNIFTFDKVKVAMTVTWLWAWAGLYVTKAFEAFFTGILKMPDKWLAIPTSDVVNSSGQRVKILSARSGKSDITNKLKLFMKLYWEKGGINSATDTNGFDFSKLAKMLNVSMMYCCYLLTDVNGNIQPEQFWNSVHAFLVEQTANGDCYRSTTVNLSDRNKLWLRNVDFEGNVNRNIRIIKINDVNTTSNDDSLDDLDDELDAYIRAGTSLEKSKPMTLGEIQQKLERN